MAKGLKRLNEWRSTVMLSPLLKGKNPNPTQTNQKHFATLPSEQWEECIFFLSIIYSLIKSHDSPCQNFHARSPPRSVCFVFLSLSLLLDSRDRALCLPWAHRFPFPLHPEARRLPSPRALLITRRWAPTVVSKGQQSQCLPQPRPGPVESCFLHRFHKHFPSPAVIVKVRNWLTDFKVILILAHGLWAEILLPTSVFTGLTLWWRKLHNRFVRFSSI